MHLEICVAPFEHLTKMRRPSKLYEGWSNGRGKNQIVLLDYLKVGLCRLGPTANVLRVEEIAAAHHPQFRLIGNALITD